MIMFKDRGQPTYLLSKNPQIKLWHRKLRYTSNARVVKASKLNDGIDIIIKDNYITEDFSFNLKKDNKEKNLGQTVPGNDKYERFPLFIVIISNTNTNNYDNSKIERLFDLCIESKYTKIVRYKKMILITWKLQEIYTDLWRPNDLFLLLKKTYIGLLLDKFIQNLWILLLKSNIKFFNTFNFDYHVLKRLAERNSDVYKLIMRENLLAQHSKTSPKKRILLLAMLYHTYIRKMEWLSDIREL